MMGREDKARGEHYFVGGLYYWFLAGEELVGGLYYWFLLEELVGELSQGAPVAGNFGLGGQETVRNPGAREPDRLFLAGWEVSQFWAELGQSWRIASV
jgi:hypothetical protein